jgi:hypothetical protein
VLSATRQCRVLLPLAAVLAIVPFSAVAAAGPQTLQLNDLIKKSVVANDSDWKALPAYTHEERDVDGKVDAGGHVHNKEAKTYRVMMMAGSPYNEVIAINGEPLDPERKAQERNKLIAERDKRASETPAARASRIEKYKKERAEEHLLMQQMVVAFRFHMAGEESIDGHDCYVLDATPNPDYKPPVSKARVLTGMKGRLWIDKKSYHWVRVHAQVVTPVEFALFIAKVRPGTEFELNQEPVDGQIWLPSHFSESVNARVLGFYDIRTRHDEYYSNYQRNVSASDAQPAVLGGTE